MPAENRKPAEAETAIPNFMNEQSRTNYLEEADSANTWLNNNLHKLMIWVSAAWFAIVLIYITQFFGWSNLFLMMPDEFGGFLAGITLPLAIIWVVMAYIDRGSSFKREAKFLRAYMNQLVYPEDGGANTAKAMADAIRSQVVELQEVTKLATAQTEKIKNELGGRVDDFAKLVGVLDTYSSKTIVELTEGVKTLVKSFETVTEKADASSQRLKETATDVSAVSNGMQNNFTALFNSLLPRIKEMKSSAELLQTVTNENSTKMQQANEQLSAFSAKSGESMTRIAEVLNGQAQRLEQVSKGAIDNCDSLYRQFDGGIGKLENILKAQSQFVIEQVSSLDSKTEKLSKRFSEQGTLVAAEVDKIMVRAQSLDESIAMQVRELAGISDKVITSLDNVEASLTDKLAVLDEKSAAAVDDVNQVISALEDRTARLGEMADMAISKTAEVSEDLDNRHKELEKLSEQSAVSLRGLAHELVDKTSLLKQQAEDSITRFNDIGQVMKKHSDSLVEASSIVVSQSKISEAALSQQQRHISTSVNRVEEIKGELKRQIDELTRAAAVIDDEATRSVDKLQKQMSQVLKSCEDVVLKTQALNDNLTAQSSSFDTSANKTLAKVSQLETVLSNKSQELDQVSKTVVDRSHEVEEVLGRQCELVGKTTEDNARTIKEVQAAFESQSSILNSVAENTVGYVSDVVQALDEKAEAINLLFKHQENEFYDICDRISENTSAISGSLKKQVSVIEQSADRVFARMALLEEDVNKRAESVVANSLKSIDKLAEIDKSIAAQNDSVAGFLDEITQKLALVSESFTQNMVGFGNTVKTIRDDSSAMAETLLNSCNKIKAANQDLAEDTRNVSGLIETHLKNLDVSLIKTRSQADGIKETLDHQKDSLTDIVNVVSTQTRLGEAALAQQYKYLSDASTEVAQKLAEINNQFKSNTDAIFDTSAKVAYEFDVLGDRLIKVSEDIQKASKNSVKSVEQVNLSLSQCTEDLAAGVNDSVSKIGNAMRDYEQSIASFNTVTAEASTGVVEINGLISQQSDKMLKISEDTKALVDCFNTVLNDTSDVLANRANLAYEKVKGLGENLKALSVEMEEASKMSVIHFENSGNKLRAGISEVAANAERISNEIRSSGEVFLKQSGVLVAATDDTIQKVNEAMSLLDTNTDKFVSKGDNIVENTIRFNDVIKKQMEQLNETAAKADSKLGDLEKRYEGVKVDNFLKEASYIIEKLETVSVDINRIFNPSAEEELWKRYYNGDTSAFVRYLSKTMTKAQVQAIRKEFEQNLEFRNLVTQYLSEFETLVGKARSNERSGILLSVISGADVGKLYYVLARSLDKLN